MGGTDGGGDDIVRREIVAARHRLETMLIPATRPDLPVIVMLHEGLGSIALWRDFPARVAARTGAAVLVYSRRGHGWSEALTGPRHVRYMHDEATKALPDVLAAFGVTRPLIVGHSDGASIALVHAGGGHPVRAVAVMAPHVFVEPICATSIAKAKQAFETTDLGARLGKYHREARKTFHLWADAWLDPAFLQWNIESFLPGIRCPVLAIQGEGDEYGTMAQVDRIKAQVAGPCELLKLPACGHAPFKDQPGKVLDAIARLVTSA